MLREGEGNEDEAQSPGRETGADTQTQTGFSNAGALSKPVELKSIFNSSGDPQVSKDQKNVLLNYRSQEEKDFQDLESLLNSKSGQQVFRWFLRSEFSEENLEFWLACKDYRIAPGTQLSSKALRIYSQFINAEAPQEVNLDAETREALTSMIEEPKSDTFDKAQQSIFSLMAKDSFPRFLRSSYCSGTLRVH